MNLDIACVITSKLAIGLAGYVVITTFLASVVAVIQERKIWKSKALPDLSLYGQVKVFAFNVVWMMGCLVGSTCIGIKWILTAGNSDVEKEGNRIVENLVGKCVLRCFVGNAQIQGLENLPPTDMIPAPVFIANHASQIDIAVVYFLERRFKWIAKKSVLYLPGVGQVMYLGGHVLIDRRTGKNKKSVNTLFEKSDAAVQAGVPMFFFPQGTRRIAERLPFKDGAFIVAQSNKSVIVPMSIEIPLNAWNSSYPFNLLWGGETPVVKMTVHKPIQVAGNEDREQLKRQCDELIYSVLPKYKEEEEEKKEK